MLAKNFMLHEEKEHTWATYPRAVADLWTSFLSVKKLIFLNGSTVRCRAEIVKDPWSIGFDSAEFPEKGKREREQRCPSEQSFRC